METESEGDGEVEATSHCKDSVTGCHHQHINILPLCVETESEGDGEVEATSHFKDPLSDWLSPSTYQYLTIMCGDRL